MNAWNGNKVLVQTLLTQMDQDSNNNIQRNKRSEDNRTSFWDVAPDIIIVVLILLWIILIYIIIPMNCTDNIFTNTSENLKIK